MKYKYLAINGEVMHAETEKTRDELIKFFIEDGIMGSMTPLVEIEEKEYWYPITEWGTFTKKQWIKKICPQLRKIYG